jgi:hypothetical protein
MVEIALPKNCKITSGKTWPYPSGATKTKEFRIYRFNPDGGHNPRIRYLRDRSQLVRADGARCLIHIKKQIDPTLTFRRSCREGVCGSCAMNIDGTNGLAWVTAIVSAMTRIPVRRDAARTGEITLRGRVWPIDGLKEKLLAALRGGIKTY